MKLIIMRKINNICFYAVMSIVAVLGILLFEKPEFKIIITIVMLIAIWFYYEIDRAQEHDDENMSM